jgi:hypothetical protein
VASGAAVDMQVSAPVPAGDVTMPEGWAGRWAMTIAVRSLATNSVTAEEVFTDSLCPGDPLGLVLLDQLQDCTGMVSDTQLEVSCQAQLSVGLCTIDATVQVQVERTSDMMNGSGQWTTTATGMCGSIPVSQGEALEITGQRVSADPGGCEPPAAVLQKFGRHPALIVLDAQQ